LGGPSANRSQDRTKYASSNAPAFPQPTFYSRGELPAPPRPPPIAMPVPQHYGGFPSRTMQHALAVSNPEPVETTPLSGLAPPRPPRLNKPHSDQAVRPVRRLSTPLSSPTRVRSVPTSPGPLSDDDQYDPDRCRARTKASGNPRCKNRRPRGVTIPLEEFATDFQSNYYCKTHLSQQVEKGGFYSSRSLEIYKQSNHQNDGYVKYSDWIPDYLSQRTRMEIMHKMNEKPSSSEELGYIYVFEIRDDDDPHMIHLKVGRTNNLLKRLQSWEKQCKSNTQVFRYYWPGTGTEKQDLVNFQRGSFQPGPAGPHTHLLERLLHLHLADLVMYAQYTDPKFPATNRPDTNDSGTSSKSAKAKGSKVAAPSYNQLALKAVQEQRGACKDCGKVHKEIFPFIRTSRGPYEGKELEKIVIPIIKKWGEFVNRYV